MTKRWECLSLQNKLLLILFYVFSMLYIGMRKFLISFFLLFITVPALAELFDFCSLNNCVAGCTAVKSVTGSVSRCVSCSEGTYTIDPYEDKCTECKYISFEGEEHTNTSKWDVCSNKLIDQQPSAAQETQSVARAATRMRAATSARAELNNESIVTPGGSGNWDVNTNPYEFNGKGCIVSVTATMPGTSEYGCAATIQCAAGRYWDGKDKGCVLCPFNTIAKEDTYDYVENGDGGGMVGGGNHPLRDKACTLCKVSANASHTKCQYSVKYSDETSSVKYDIGTSFKTKGAQPVEAGYYFGGWSCSIQWCEDGLCKFRDCAVKTFESDTNITRHEIIDAEEEYTLTGIVKPCPKGSYCPGGTAGKQTCPHGLTTEGTGATSENDCGLDDTVVFEDNKGEFTLPIEKFFNTRL